MKNLKVMSVLAGMAWIAACSSDSGGGASAGGASGQSSGGSSSGGASGTGGKTTEGTGGQSSGGTTAKGGSGAGGAVGSGGAAQGGQAGSGSGGAGGKGSGGGTVSGSGGGVAGQPGSGGKPGSGGSTGVGGAGTGGATGLGGGTAPGGSTGSGGGPGSGGSTGTGTQHWVGTWTASPYADSNSNNTPPVSLSNSVVRQIAHVSLGGSQIRVQFSNVQGNGALTITGAHIALCKSSTLADSTIDAATDKALAFSGSASATVAAGKEIWSDPIDFTVPNQGNVTITTLFGSVPSTLTQHSGSRTNSYFKSGGAAADLNAASMSSAQAKPLWFFISGIDVMADASAVGVVAIGDSITDGRGTDNDKNNRWTDIMAARLQANAATKNVATMNQGIGATNLVGSSGTAAQARFARDVLGQSGVKYVIVLDGVNDIHGGTSYNSMKSAYDDLIKRAHDKGLKIYGGTILPFGGSSDYYSASAESTRQQVNTYIKSGVFDGVIDFDAALSDGGSPPKLKAEYAAWTPNNPQGSADGLHPGTAGYQKMGETPDLTLFTK
jgi:lysophospholipase L1-like esterase